jgi:hypothetical protein
MKKNTTISIFYFIIAATIAVLTFWIARHSASPSTLIAPTKAIEVFSENNGNYIVADTFIMLVNKAYDGIATVNKTNTNITINMQNANIITKDFFNGNDKLLNCTVDKNGFDIKYNTIDKSLVANFKLKQNAVFVPNDVMIKLIDKTSNAKKGMPL